MKLINSLSEYNYMISRINFEASNKYNSLQNLNNKNTFPFI